MTPNRYHRQSLVPALGEAGTRRLHASHVLLLGVGALGSTAAEHLVRAGIGALTLVDRDVVELTNLQRQSLYGEEDAARGVAKVEAATQRLRAINADVALDAHAIDVDATNVESLLTGRGVDLILDGSDNAELRYLVNDVSVKHAIPWVMAGCLGVEGRVAAFVPGGSSGSPCLRCLFPMPPSSGELATCDTAGVLGPAIGVVASMQVAEVMKVLVCDPSAGAKLLSVDVWDGRFHSIALADARRAHCPCCGQRRFDFLDATRAAGTKLCGRNAMQVRGAVGTRVDLSTLADRLRPVASVDATPLMLRLVLHERPELSMSVFADGRMIVFGTDDPSLARSIYARVVGI